MKKNNIYKNAINLFKKSDSLFLQRVGDDIYLSDGHCIYRIPNYDYSLEFCTASPRFPQLSSEEKRSAHNMDKLTQEDGIDIKKCLEDMKNCTFKDAQRLNITCPMDDLPSLETFRVENEIVFVNSIYTSMIPKHRTMSGADSNVYTSLTYNNSAPRSPIYFEGALEDMSIVILPVNRPTCLDRFKALEGIVF